MEDTPDFSKAFETLQQMLSNDEGQSQIQNIVNMLSAPGETENPSNQANFNSSENPFSENFDFETILKIQNIMQSVNNQKNNPKIAFLHALKPFLKKDRQAKLDQTAKLIQMASVLKVFKESNKGGN